MADKHSKKQAPGAETEVDLNADESTPEMPDANAGAENSDGESEALKAELADWKDKFIRQAAEFDNFKRRNAKEKVEMIQTAGKEVITEMLEVLDDCDRAQKQMESSDDVNAIKEGVLLVFNKLRSVLQARGLKAMETIHQDFDADLHEAITEIPASDPGLKGKVVDEVMKGYYLKDKIIRHAKVVVGK